MKILFFSLVIFTSTSSLYRSFVLIKIMRSNKITLLQNLVSTISCLLIINLTLFCNNAKAEHTKLFNRGVYYTNLGDSIHTHHFDFIFNYLENQTLIPLEKAIAIEQGEKNLKANNSKSYSSELYESQFSHLIKIIAESKSNQFLGVVIYNRLGFAESFYGIRPKSLFIEKSITSKINFKLSKKNVFNHIEPLAIIKKLNCNELAGSNPYLKCNDKTYGLYRPIISSKIIGYSLILVNKNRIIDKGHEKEF